jgi:hypothetical protein
MAKKSPYGTPAVREQPVKFIPNDPAPTVAGSLKNSQAQVDKAGKQ